MPTQRLEPGDREGGDRSRYCGGVPGPAYRNSPLSRPSWVIVPISSTSVGADPEQDVDAQVAMASSERCNQTTHHLRQIIGLTFAHPRARKRLVCAHFMLSVYSTG